MALCINFVPAVMLPPPHRPTGHHLPNASPTRLAGGMAGGSVELSVIPAKPDMIHQHERV